MLVDRRIGLLIFEVLISGSAFRGIQAPAHGEDGIAQRLGIEPAGVHVGEEAVGTVDRLRISDFGFRITRSRRGSIR